MANRVEDLESMVAAARTTLEQAHKRLSEAKEAAIAAMTSRQPVEALVIQKVLREDEREVVAVRAADAAASAPRPPARTPLRAAQSASIHLKQDLLDLEGPARHAAEVAERERRMALVERAVPQLLADLEEARERLAEVSRYEVPDRATPAVGRRAHQAWQRVVTLERELNERLAEAPNEVAPATSVRGKR